MPSWPCARDDPNTIVAAKKSSPMIFGYGDGCNFVASDVTAVLRYTREVVYLSDGDLVEMTADSVHFYDRQGKNWRGPPSTLIGSSPPPRRTAMTIL